MKEILDIAERFIVPENFLTWSLSLFFTLMLANFLTVVIFSPIKRHGNVVVDQELRILMTLDIFQLVLYSYFLVQSFQMLFNTSMDILGR